MTCVDDEYPLEDVVCPVRRTKQSCVKSQVRKISALSCSLGAVVQPARIEPARMQPARMQPARKMGRIVPGWHDSWLA